MPIKGTQTTDLIVVPYAAQWQRLKRLVLDSVSSPITKRVYNLGLDFNGDGIADLAVPDFNGGVSVLLGNGDGTFQAAVNYAAGRTPESVAMGDFNGDGIADLAFAGYNGTRPRRPASADSDDCGETAATSQRGQRSEQAAIPPRIQLEHERWIGSGRDPVVTFLVARPEPVARGRCIDCRSAQGSCPEPFPPSTRTFTVARPNDLETGLE